LEDEEQATIGQIFRDFEEVLGPVGAAKCLHLMAPKFFPLWDRAIAGAYGLPLSKRGENFGTYFRFMEVAREQVKILGGEQAIGRNPLKALDEYNYCKHTRQWI
jgi:hypothetical protein